MSGNAELWSRAEAAAENHLLTSGGGGNCVTFRQFVNEALVPAPRPGQVVVMDNLSSHKTAGIREAIEAAGCRLLYLPPYSPDYNPTGNAIFKIKSHLKKLAARTVDTLGQAIQEALQTITRHDDAGFFRHAGYATAM